MNRKYKTAAILLCLNASLFFGCSSDGQDKAKENKETAVISSDVSEHGYETADKIVTAESEEKTEASLTDEVKSGEAVPDVYVSEFTDISDSFSDYPDYKNIVQGPVICRYSFKKTCEICGNDYHYLQIESSKYMTSEQIAKYNSDLEKLEDSGLSRMKVKKHYISHSKLSPKIGFCCNPFESWYWYGLNLWVDNEHDIFFKFYDPDTYELLSLEDIFGEDWQDYCEYKNEYGIENVAEYECYVANNKKLKCFELMVSGWPDNNESGSVSYNGNIPWENVNKKYITPPEGWDEVWEKILEDN